VADPGIIRHRGKIFSALQNAVAFRAIQEEWGSFDAFVWRFVDGHPIVNEWRAFAEVPTRTAESDALAKELKRLGMKFVGTTIVYAYMQAVGLVNDHLVGCICRTRESGL
jgi:DNA-3-methyladenine glycosylase I